MAIAFSCECGKRFRAKDEHAGKRSKCPVCGRELMIPVQAVRQSQAAPTCPPEPLPKNDPDEIPSISPTVPKIETRSPKEWPLRGSAFALVTGKPSIFWIAGAGTMLVLMGFIAGAGWREKAPIAALDIAKGALQGKRNIPTRPLYTILSEDEGPGFPVRDVRLNMKVSKEELEEIALELKPTRPTLHGLFTIYYYLPGMEPTNNRGGANWHPWGVTQSYPAFRTRIVGLTIEEERRLRNKPLELPEGSESLGTWLADDWIQNARMTNYRNTGISDDAYNHLVQQMIDSHRVTIYRNTAGNSRLLYDGDKVPTVLALKETRSEDGITFEVIRGIHRFVIDRKGILRAYDEDNELISVPKRIKPPTAVPRGITEVQSKDGTMVKLVGSSVRPDR
jgi:hypothetical protein